MKSRTKVNSSFSEQAALLIGALILKPSAHTPKPFHQHGIGEKRTSHN